MLLFGTCPRTDAFNAAIHACARWGHIDQAEYYMRKMLGLGVRPNVMSYNVLINVCAEARDAKRAELLFREMERCGQKPNTTTFGIMCKVYAREGWPEAVANTMTEFERTGGVLSEQFFVALISACCKQQPPDIQGIRIALQDMQARGLDLDKARPTLRKSLGPHAAGQLLQEARPSPFEPGLLPAVHGGKMFGAYQGLEPDLDSHEGQVPRNLPPVPTQALVPIAASAMWPIPMKHSVTSTATQRHMPQLAFADMPPNGPPPGLSDAMEIYELLPSNVRECLASGPPPPEVVSVPLPMKLFGHDRDSC